MLKMLIFLYVLMLPFFFILARDIYFMGVSESVFTKKNTYIYHILEHGKMCILAYPYTYMYRYSIVDIFQFS